jgi:hypothetical protein
MTVEEGNYSIELLELPPGYVMTSVKIGDRDVTKVPFRVTDGTPEVVITVTAPVTKPWRRVEGVIVNPLNAGGTSAETVQLQDSGMNLWLEAMVGPDGRFAFPKVLPGTYITRLVSSATRPDILGLPIINENPTLVVTDSDIRDLRLERVTTPLLAAVTARVTVDDDGPRPSVQFQIDGKPLSSSQADLLDGRLLLRLPYGEHRIGATVSLDGIIVKSLRYGDIDLLKNTARIVPGQREELVVVLTAPIPRVLHRVQGRIVRQGPPATQERVTLDGDHQRVSVLANPDGSFDFPRVTAGVYRWSTQEIVVPDRDVTDLILRVGARVPVVVDVTGDDGRGQQDLPHCPFEIRSSSGTGNCALSGSALQVRDGDRVTVNNLPAWYKLESLRYGSIDLLRDPFLFDGTSTAIRIGITPSGPPPGRPAYTLRGRVVGRKEGQINLLVRLRAAVGGGSLDQRVADDGSFAFTNVLPSTYELQVVGSTSRARVVVSGADVGDIVLLAAP